MEAKEQVAVRVPYTDTELTKLAAEKIMGWTIRKRLSGIFESERWQAVSPDNHRVWLTDASGSYGERWNPLKDWRAAGEIIDKMRADGWTFFVEGEFNAAARFTKHTEGPWWKYDRSAQRVITIAALLAVGAIDESRL